VRLARGARGHVLGLRVALRAAVAGAAVAERRLRRRLERLDLLGDRKPEQRGGERLDLLLVAAVADRRDVPEQPRAERALDLVGADAAFASRWFSTR
jgi:hypothetical protein